jgi:hypothetical protein
MACPGDPKEEFVGTKHDFKLLHFGFEKPIPEIMATWDK